MTAQPTSDASARLLARCAWERCSTTIEVERPDTVPPGWYVLAGPGQFGRYCSPACVADACDALVAPDQPDRNEDSDEESAAWFDAALVEWFRLEPSEVFESDEVGLDDDVLGDVGSQDDEEDWAGDTLAEDAAFEREMAALEYAAWEDEIADRDDRDFLKGHGPYVDDDSPFDDESWDDDEPIGESFGELQGLRIERLVPEDRDGWDGEYASGDEELDDWNP